MIERGLIHIGGPAGAGKTALIEALLRSNRSKLIAVMRATIDDGCDELEESVPAGDEELGRYNDAGAYAATCCRFSAEARADESFFHTSLMSDYSNAVLIEGDSPIGGLSDLSVFVTRVLPKGAPLLSRRTRSGASSPGGSLNLQAMSNTLTRDGAEALMSMFERLGAATSARARGSRPVWTLALACKGIERAQVVVINVSGAAERARAEAMAEAVVRLRKDREVCMDVLGPFGKRRPITVQVADLSDPKDKGLKRVIQRIKRAIP